MKIIFAIGLTALLASVPVSTASARGCPALKRACEGYRGTGDAACAAAYKQCLQTCKFVGPGTGRVYVATGPGKCKRNRKK